jgi:UDP-N-acetyl-D-mannosaminuronic acid dehydrogenase
LEALKISKLLCEVEICDRESTFRSWIKEFHCNRNIALAELLFAKGLDVYACDPHLSEEDVRVQGLRYIQSEEADLIFDSFDLSFRLRQK